MAISPEQLAQIINHNSSTLCSPKGQKKLNEMAGAVNVNNMNSDMVSDEWDNFSLSEPSTPNTKMQQNMNKPISENALSRSKMPDAIKQSMLKHQIDTSGLMPGNDMSFLNEVAKQRKQNITEESYYQPSTTSPVPQQQYIPQQQYVPQQMIDYGYLKHIISECISEYFSKQPLNEGTTLKQIGLTEGKIKLVDNKGNVFAAELEFKGNINERKKK